MPRLTHLIATYKKYRSQVVLTNRLSESVLEYLEFNGIIIFFFTARGNWLKLPIRNQISITPLVKIIRKRTDYAYARMTQWPIKSVSDDSTRVIEYLPERHFKKNSAKPKIPDFANMH